MARGKYASYKETKVFREATKSMKREIENYIKEYNPTNDEMYLQLRRYELKNLDKKEQRTPNVIFSFILVIMVIVFYFIILNEKDTPSNPIILLLFTVIMLVMCIGYYAGWFSKTKAELRSIEKELNSSPNLPEFTGIKKQ